MDFYTIEDGFQFIKQQLQDKKLCSSDVYRAITEYCLKINNFIEAKSFLELSDQVIEKNSKIDAILNKITRVKLTLKSKLTKAN